MNIKIDELLQRYAAGERNFQNVDVQGPCYVEGVDLHRINLSGSVLGELSLNGFNFRGATLERVNFQSSGLRNANFEAAKKNLAPEYCFGCQVLGTYNSKFLFGFRQIYLLLQIAC